MMLLRHCTIVAVLVLVILQGGPAVRRRSLAFWREHRVVRFEADASRSMAYLLQPTRWLEFEIPPQAQILRVLTNATVQDFSARPATREQPRAGWQYALDYQLLGSDGRLLQASQYHLRASVIQCRDPETGAVQAISWLGQSAGIPTITRTVQLPLDSAELVARRLRLRLAERDAAVQEVVVRIYMRSERAGYDQPYVWSRLSPQRTTGSVAPWFTRRSY